MYHVINKFRMTVKADHWSHMAISPSVAFSTTMQSFVSVC